MNEMKDRGRQRQRVTLLPEPLLRKLDRLHFAVHRPFAGRVGGLEVSRRLGTSLEFAEHRKYLAGDDYRYIDWNLYGRLDRLFVKVFSREEDYPVYLLLDSSRSMGVGGKLAYARRLAAALGYVGLKDQNRVGAYPFAASLEAERGWPARAGLGQLRGLLEYLDGLTVGGETALDAALGRFARLGLERGLAVVLSDMLCKAGYADGLADLRVAGFEVAVIQVLAGVDLDPPVRGEATLSPAEGSRARRLVVGPASRRAYLKALEAYVRALRDFCQRHEIAFVQLSTRMSLEEALLERLRGRRRERVLR